nr:hypothetical protein [uncultured Draconibacterium sp.]
MRKYIIMVLVASLCAVTTVFGQDNTKHKKKSKFGSFMKKVGEATTGINMTDELFMVNSLSSTFKVEFVSCTGSSAAQTFDVVLKITNKATNERLCVGGSCTGNTTAIDSEGNSYKSAYCAGDCKDFPTNVPVKVNISFEKILPDVSYLESLKFNIGDKGEVEIRNIPVQWDVAAVEQNQNTSEVAENDGLLSNSIASEFDAELVGCYGDSVKQSIEIVLKLKNKSTNKKLCIGGSCSGKSMAVDVDGNSYESSSCAGDCKDFPTGVFIKSIVTFEKILPTVQKLDYVKLNIGDEGNIEMRGLPVDWTAQP